MASSIKCTSLKKLVQGLLARRFLLRVFMLISAMATLPFLFVSELNLVEFLAVSSGDCAAHQLVASGNYLKPLTFLESHHSSSACHADNNFTYAVFRALMDVNLIPSNAKALCVGEISGAAVRALRKLGFPHPISANRGPLSVLQRKDFVEELPFENGSFDFIFSRGLNKASAPALHVLEMERVLKPGGTGAVMEPVATADPSSMIKAATPVSSFLKCSDIVYVGMIDGFALAVFKKRTDDLSSIEQLHLPKGCLSVTNNRPFTRFLEPLVEKVHVEDRKNVVYLSERMNISNRRQLMYVDVGAGRYKDSSIASWFLPFYPKQSLPLQIYALDHDSSTLSSFAQRHDITFVYYPGLGEESRPVADYDPLDDSGALPFDDGDESDMFDFLGWFKDAVEDEDFVVLKMSVGGVGLRDLLELVESGAICLVDELFLHCPDTMGGGDATTGSCLQIFKTLRRMGVYVHQW